jgi:hypothetical protein
LLNRDTRGIQPAHSRDCPCPRQASESVNLKGVVNKIIAAFLETLSPFAIVEIPMTTIAQLIKQLSRFDGDTPVMVHDSRGKLAEIEEVELIDFRKEEHPPDLDEDELILDGTYVVIR